MGRSLRPVPALCFSAFENRVTDLGMPASQYPPNTTRTSKLPHPAVFLAALLLASLGAWCWLAESGESTPSIQILREKAALDRAEFQRATRQAASARDRLLQAQQRLEAFTRQQYEELHQVAGGNSPDNQALDRRVAVMPAESEFGAAQQQIRRSSWKQIDWALD